MKNGRPQAKDIADADALAAVVDCMDHPAIPKTDTDPGCEGRHGPASRWAVADRLGFPREVVLAKLRSLVKRKLVTGCTCGCRGDFELTKGGEAVLAGPNGIAKEIEVVMHLAKEFYQ